MLSQSNALAEIALALAMAFFSIMILSMVSMGAVSSAEDHSKIGHSQSLKFQGSSETSRTKNVDGNSNTISTDSMVIFYDGIFYDGHLNHLEKSELLHRNTKILAVSPDLPSSEAIALRKLFSAKDLTLTVLNSEWLNIIKERAK